MKQRIEWVDIAKCVCILCVMASHLRFIPAAAERFMEPFYLTVFFFCSGYVYRHKDGFREFLLRKVRQLLIPWLVFSLLSILLSQILTFQPHGDLGAELLWCFLQIRGQGDQMWFVAALFMAFLPFYFAIRLWRNRPGLLLGVSFLLSLGSVLYMRFMDGSRLPWGTAHLPWHLETLFQGMFFMALGWLYRNRWETRLDTLPKTWGLAALAVYLPLVYGAGGSIPVDYACQLLGIVWMVCLCKSIPGSRYLSYIGQNTLICFGLNGKLASLINTFVELPTPSALAAAAFALLMSAALLVPIWVINRWFPFAAGRSAKNNQGFPNFSRRMGVKSEKNS